MSRTVVRASLVILMVVVLTSLRPGISVAGTSLGQLCLGFGTDTIRMDLTLSDGPAFLIDVAFRWRAIDKFEMLGNGVITDLYPLGDKPPGSLAVGLNASNNTAWYLGNPICSIRATLSPPSFSGPFVVTCVGGGGAIGGISGTLNIVSCATEPH
jgi:hypothetical protein